VKVWIDTATGTWGAVDELVIVDLDDPELHDPYTDAVSLEIFLEEATDSEVNDFGRRHGKKVNA
jgi:hypothetical protein